MATKTPRNMPINGIDYLILGLKCSANKFLYQEAIKNNLVTQKYFEPTNQSKSGFKSSIKNLFGEEKFNELQNTLYNEKDEKVMNTLMYDLDELLTKVYPRWDNYFKANPITTNIRIIIFRKNI